LGAVGKHTLLIHPRFGSWFFIGGVLTTLDLSSDADVRRVPDLCGSCTKCIDACPTGAIEPYSVDATRCISYLTIEHRSLIAAEFEEPMRDAGFIYGCDICQEVCPHNQPLPAGSARAAGVADANAAYSAFESGVDRVEQGTRFDLLRVLGWSEEDKRVALQRSAMKRAKRWMFKRNALVVLGRPQDPALEERDGVDVDNA
jgi:epoxyqueuosine reductase